MRLLLLLTTLACAFPSVWSHTYLVSPKPRNEPAYRENPVSAGDIVKYGYTAQGTFPSFNTIGWCGTPTRSRTAAAIPATSVATNFPDGTPAVTTGNTYTAGGTIKVFWYHPLPHPDDNIGTAAVPIFQYGIRVALNYSSTEMVVLNPHVGGAAKSANGILNGHIEQGTGSDPQANAEGWVPNATFVLPAGKTCNNCVLQFWLDSASDFGGYVDCADISISAAAATPAPTATTAAPATTPAPSTTTAPAATQAPAATAAPRTTTAPPRTTTAPPRATAPPTPKYSSSTRASSHLLLVMASMVMTWLFL